MKLKYFNTKHFSVLCLRALKANCTLIKSLCLPVENIEVFVRVGSDLIKK